MPFDDLEDAQEETNVRQFPGGVPLGMRIAKMGANWMPQPGMTRAVPGDGQPGSRADARTDTEQQAQSSSGHWWNRLFPSKQDEPPPPDPPPPLKLPSPYDMLKPDGGDWKKTGLWNPGMAAVFDSSRFGNRNLEDIAGTLYNENKTLRAGDPQKGLKDQKQLDDGSRAMAHAILNNSFKGYKLGRVAPSDVAEQEKNSDLYKHYAEIARQALWEHMNNNDPVQGLTQYNHRDHYDVGNRIVKFPNEKKGRPDPDQPVFQQYGPFLDIRGGRKWIVFYGKRSQPSK